MSPGLVSGNKGVSATTIIAEFLDPFYGMYWCMRREKEGRFCGETGAAYLSIRSNEVKVWGQVLVGGLLWLGGIPW